VTESTNYVAFAGHLNINTFTTVTNFSGMCEDKNMKDMQQVIAIITSRCFAVATRSVLQYHPVPSRELEQEVVGMTTMPSKYGMNIV